MPPQDSNVHVTLNTDEKNVVSPVTVAWILTEEASSTEVDIQKLQSENEHLRHQLENIRWEGGGHSTET